MKPGEHPEFFRFPAPEGRSRESTIRLDGEGRFFHDDALVEHPKLRDALHTWIARHPDDGRYILTNGYDWTYFVVEDVPYFVRSLRAEDGDAILVLSDATEEPLDPSTVRANERGELYLKVKADGEGRPLRRQDDAVRAGPARARFSRTSDGAAGTVSLVTKRGRATIPAT